MELKMGRDKYTLIQELSPDEVDDISPAYKASLVSQGLKPYLTSNGTIKWASEATMLYKYGQSKKLFRVFPARSRSYQKNRVKRGHRNHFWLFVKDNLWLIFAGLALVALLVAAFGYNLFLY